MASRPKRLVWSMDWPNYNPHYWTNKCDSFQDALESLSETYQVHVVAWHPTQNSECLMRGVRYHFRREIETVARRVADLSPDLLNHWGFFRPVNVMLQKLCPKVPKTVYHVGTRLARLASDLPHVQRVFVNTETDRAALAKTFRGPPDRWVVCPFCATGGCQPKSYRGAERYDVIYVSDWRLGKRQHLLLEALDHIQFRRVLFLGSRSDVEYFDEHSQKIYAPHNRGWIELIDRVPGFTVPDYYRESKVAVHLSRSEGGSRVLIEALACGVPLIVCSDCESNCAQVQHGETGFIVDPDPAAIAAQIRVVLHDAQLRQRVGKAAAASIARPQDADSMTAIFKREFTAILNGG